jgi:hypothetical protein
LSLEPTQEPRYKSWIHTDFLDSNREAGCPWKIDLPITLLKAQSASIHHPQGNPLKIQKIVTAAYVVTTARL